MVKYGLINEDYSINLYHVQFLYNNQNHFSCDKNVHPLHKTRFSLHFYFLLNVKNLNIV